MILQYGVLAFLALISIIDIKYKEIPSILMTTGLMIVAIANIDNLAFGVFSGLFALFLYELGEDINMPFGMADIKAMILVGLMTSTYIQFFGFIMAFGVFQFVYIFTIRRYLVKKGEIPFLPVFFIVYASLLIGGVVW